MSCFTKCVRHTLLAALILGVMACGKKDDTGNATTTPAATALARGPDAAVMEKVELLRSGDFSGLMYSSIPPAKLEEAKADWLNQFKKDDVSEEDRAQFAETMAKLTSATAEADLMAEIRPQLEQLQTDEMRAQLPMMIAMGKSFAVAAINESQDVTAEQKPQIVALVNALGTWAEKGEFASIERAERAVGETVRAARALPARTMDDLQALDYDGSMRALGIAWGGLKGVLNAYDIDLDRSLASTRAEVLSRDGSQAKVRVHTELLGAPLNFDVDMVEVDGRWYGKEVLEGSKKDDGA